jgi:Ca2+-binding EF-hand superfamily protein
MKQSKAKWADLLKNSKLASNGRLALEEFKALMPRGMGTKELFDSLDDDGNGWLEKKEMREFIRKKIREEGKAVSAAMKESPCAGGAINSITTAHHANISRLVFANFC